MPIQGKVAIVTGSTSGIGQVVAQTFASHGIKVIVHGQNRERGEAKVENINRSGGQALFFQADLLDHDSPQKLVAFAVDSWGRVDIIVNNAALVLNKPIGSITRQDWDSRIHVNLLAPFFLIQAALPQLKKNKGSVTNISSTNSLRNQPNNLVYDTTKAALNHMTTGLALDLKKEGIRVNALAVGGTDTPALTRWNSQFMNDPEEIRKKIDGNREKGYLASPQQIADIVLFLAKDQASWVNGAVIPVDNGNYLG